MPIRHEKRWFTPAMCRAEPDALFVFGDNLKRYGKRGQAVIRDEPNAVGIPTKRAPRLTQEAFYDDSRNSLDDYVKASNYDWVRLEQHLERGGLVVLPADGLGTGLADLKRRAPLVWERMQSDIRGLHRILGPNSPADEVGAPSPIRQAEGA